MNIKTENQEQCEFVSWMKKEHPQHWVYSIPNGANRSRERGRQHKNSGQANGVPDLCIPSLFLYIEMKVVGGGRVSPDQRQWIAHLIAHGYTAVVCEGAEAAKQTVLRVKKEMEQSDENS